MVDFWAHYHCPAGDPTLVEERDKAEREGEGELTRSLDSLAAAQVAKLKHTIVALSESWVVSLHRNPHPSENARMSRFDA